MSTVSNAVLITGCSTGIGRATAEHLAGKGLTVYATARRVDAIADLEGKGCRTLALDVTSEESMRAAVDAVVEREGAVGALVNNAGYSQSGAVESVAMDEVRRQFETNVFGLVRMCQLVLPGMRGQGRGRIVNVSSMGGNFTFPGGGFYHATKYAVEAISDALRFEVRDFGVGVAIIQPGIIKTSFADTAVGHLAPAEGDGPYAAFNAAVGTATVDVYERRVAAATMGAGPEAVAKAIHHAITAPRPKIRYRVPPALNLVIAQRRMTPDRLWDRMMATAFPRPGKG
jgi:NAD(P)-dependent dehydrogenase (short-subunit alcohol dehydrogenase family)